MERALSIFLQLYRDIRYSLSPRYEIELTFSRLCWLSEYVSNAEVKKAIDAAQRLLMGAGAVAGNGAGAAAAVAAPVSVASEEPAPSPVSEPVRSTPLPEGLPQFSALKEDENNGPFLNGGPLPPEQSVEQIEPPADSDDGWTNTDDPPEDDYDYGEEIQAEEAQASYEDALANEQAAENKVVAQLDEHVTTADGRDITIAQLRGSVVAELAVNEGFIASVLERTGLWKVSENKVETTIESTLDLQLIQKNLRTVADRISKIFGKPMEFVVTEKQEQQTQDQAQEEVPVQVQVLVNAFKGTVVTGGKNESI